MQIERKDGHVWNKEKKTHLVITTVLLCINYFNLLIKATHSSKSPPPFLRSTFDSCRKWESVAFWGEEGPFKILINVVHIRGRMLTCMKLGGTGAKKAASYLDCTRLFCIVTRETLSEGVSERIRVSLCLQPLTFTQSGKVVHLRQLIIKLLLLFSRNPALNVN